MELALSIRLTRDRIHVSISTVDKLIWRNQIALLATICRFSDGDLTYFVNMGKLIVNVADIGNILNELSVRQTGLSRVSYVPHASSAS